MDVFARFSAVVPPEHGEAVRDAYQTYFDMIAAQGKIEEMRNLVDLASKSPFVDDLPLRAYALRIAGAILEKQGLVAFTECLSGYESLIKGSGGSDVLDSARTLLGISKQLEQKRPELLKYL